MTKKTVLQLVQKLGEAIGSDEIDALNETTEVVEITSILQQVYEEVLDRKRWEFLKDRVRQLDARAGGSTQLNTLVIPSDVTRISYLKYRSDNEVEDYTQLTYVSAREFVDKVQRRNPADADITTIVNDDGVNLFIVTNKAPTFWTSFDEETISFDGYDATRGTGNLIADSVIIADIVPVVDFTDPAATLPIPQRMETLIFNEAISTCAIRLRQTVDPKAEKIATRQHRALREQLHVTNKDTQEINHGRRSRSGR